MIAFDDLCAALDRYNYRLHGGVEPVPAQRAPDDATLEGGDYALSPDGNQGAEALHIDTSRRREDTTGELDLVDDDELR